MGDMVRLLCIPGRGFVWFPSWAYLEGGWYGSLAGRTWKMVGMVPWLVIPGRWLEWFHGWVYLEDGWYGSLAGYTWKMVGMVPWLGIPGRWLVSDPYPAFFLLIATTSNKNF